jgi:hypothetical protein
MVTRLDQEERRMQGTTLIEQPELRRENGNPPESCLPLGGHDAGSYIRLEQIVQASDIRRQRLEKAGANGQTAFPISIVHIHPLCR